jgi:hypothetical protein
VRRAGPGNVFAYGRALTRLAPDDS